METIKLKSRKEPTADNFFDSVDYVSIIDTVKGIFTSDGSIATLLDFERVLDQSDLYAFKNWEAGELVQGPDVKKYTVSCTFMYPYKLMPDPRGAKRLVAVGCKIKFKKTKIKVPVQVDNYDDFMPGGKYPKMAEKRVWLILIQVPKELMDDIKEGSIDLAGQTIDLQDISDSYDEDLDQEATSEEQTGEAPEGEMGEAPAAPTM
ncbi:MAG: hypothetical protein ACOVLB_01260 [Candidatus Nanopelagicus sp.]